MTYIRIKVEPSAIHSILWGGYSDQDYGIHLHHKLMQKIKQKSNLISHRMTPKLFHDL